MITRADNWAEARRSTQAVLFPPAVHWWGFLLSTIDLAIPPLPLCRYENVTKSRSQHWVDSNNANPHIAGMTREIISKQLWQSLLPLLPPQQPSPQGGCSQYDFRRCREYLRQRGSKARIMKEVINIYPTSDLKEQVQIWQSFFDQLAKVPKLRARIRR